MELTTHRPKQILFISIMVALFGLAMIAYWIAFIAQGIPLDGIPLASELVNAILALIAAWGLFGMKRWSYALGLIVAGMWIYGLLGGISMVLSDGLDFTSPIGALTDAILFVLVLIFAVYMAIGLWRNRDLFC